MKSSLSRRVKSVVVECVEALEARCLLSVTNISTIATQSVNPDGTATTITLNNFLSDPQVTGGTLIQMQTPLGNIPLQLDNAVAPLTVSNFLTYVNSGEYTPTIFQRVATGFVLQGGGTKPDGSDNAAIGQTNSAGGTVVGEHSLSNSVGTIAMALTGSPDSATNQWFINLANNTNLDVAANNQGPFTVFGNVIDNGMSVVNAIVALPLIDGGQENMNWGGMLGAVLPVMNYTGANPLPSGQTVPQSNLVTDNVVQISASQAITYSASVANPAILNASITNGVLSLTSPSTTTSGVTNVTVTGTDLSGQSMSQTFAVSVANGMTVNVTLGSGGAKSVNYLDTNGTNATLSLTGSGSAVVQFSGTDLNPVTNSRKNTVTLSSTTASVASITLTSTDSTSAFKITTKGGTKMIDVGTLTSGTLASFTGKGVMLTGDVNASGGITMLSVAGATGGTINATALGTVAVSGAFSDGLTLSSSAVSLNKFTAGGITGGAWSISGTVDSLTTKGISSWSASFDNIKSMTVNGDFGGTVSATSIKALSVKGMLTANLTSGTITSLMVKGGVNNATVKTTSSGLDLAKVMVGGAVTGSTFNASGNVGTFAARELVNSQIYAGVGNLVSGQPLPNFNTDFVTPASIAAVTLKAPGSTTAFSNSDIAAQTLGKLTLGTIQTSNGGAVTGVAAESIALVSGTANKKFSLKKLTSTSNVSQILTGLGVNLVDFVVKLF